MDNWFNVESEIPHEYKSAGIWNMCSEEVGHRLFQLDDILNVMMDVPRRQKHDLRTPPR